MEMVMLTSTFSRMTKYAPAITAAIDRNWPQHPKNYFIADCAVPRIKDQFSLMDACWTEVLLFGLTQIKEKHPGLTHVFYMIDDHCPLRPCDSEIISAYLEIAQRRGLAAIWFPTFEWPWDETASSIEYPDGLVAGWRTIQIDIMDGRRLAVVPRNFFRYFAVQPACWSLEYLIRACKIALDRGIRDTWAFEELRWEEAAQHYIADYHWPSVHHGFMAAGTINPTAIAYMSRAHAGELRTQLIRDSIGINNVVLYRVYRQIRRLAHRVKTQLWPVGTS
jgi:hypothetical protein